MIIIRRTKVHLFPGKYSDSSQFFWRGVDEEAPKFSSYALFTERKSIKDTERYSVMGLPSKSGHEQRGERGEKSNNKLRIIAGNGIGMEVLMRKLK